MFCLQSLMSKLLRHLPPLFEDGQIQLFTWNDIKEKRLLAFICTCISTSHSCPIPQSQTHHRTSHRKWILLRCGFRDQSITEKELKDIEKKFLEFARQKFEFKMRSASKQEALDFYHKDENPYKIELIENLEDGTITFCDHADFTDLCRGGHIPHTGFIKAVKLLNVAGAYWRGDENNKQLTRVFMYFFSQTNRIDRIP